MAPQRDQGRGGKARESVLLVDVILESKRKAANHEMRRRGGATITTTIAVKLLQFLGQLKSTFWQYFDIRFECVWGKPLIELHWELFLWQVLREIESK